MSKFNDKGKDVSIWGNPEWQEVKKLGKQEVDLNIPLYFVLIVRVFSDEQNSYSKVNS